MNTVQCIRNYQNACVARIPLIKFFKKMLGMLIECFTLILQMPLGMLVDSVVGTNGVVFYILLVPFSILDFRDEDMEQCIQNTELTN